MTKLMLIDATHVEETRVAVVDGKRLLEFDYESTVRKQLKGGIFLAKVTRVEPSLQAAFVNFGGNRHGFLPFSEIHPDYFRIPVADREALIAAQQAELEEHDEEFSDDAEEDAGEDVQANSDDQQPVAHEEEDDDDDEEEEDIIEVGGSDKPVADDLDEENQPGNRKEKEPSDDQEDHIEAEAAPGNSDEENAEGEDRDNGRGRRGRRGGRGRQQRGGRGGGRHASSRNRQTEMLGGDGADSDRPFRFNLRRQYKIQEVVKRGQIMLIQVSKEERGNKGAAVTTYLSLPGRYCVLMPNSPRGGGVSRKIAHFKDRKRMREILSDLTVPEGMSVILRTAGVQRNKTEIKRDLDYLTRLWNTIREDTLSSSAPAMIYEEGNLIKRSIRDLYDKDIDEIYVSGEEGYKVTKNFMKMLIPSHVKKVQEYKHEKIPLFHKYNVEAQITEIGEPSVTLKSGGYLVINPTEALVSVDVNSGKATKERHIEETALKTNLEAADEVARQLRLRDLGGLVVIDFIDMEDRRNNRKVEQRLKDALSKDRARIQVGRISSFGLLELSRQRLNPSLTEAQFEICKHCQGIGYVRTLDFAAITAMRALEDEGIKAVASELSLTVSDQVAIYILNNKRQMIADIEKRYGFRVHVRADEEFSSSQFKLDVIRKFSQDDDGEDEVKAADEPKEKNESKEETTSGDGEDGGQRPRGRRRGRRGGRRRNAGRQPRTDSEEQNAGESNEANEGKQEQSTEENAPAAAVEKPEKESKPARPRRGGRKPANKSQEDKEQPTDKMADKPVEKAEKKPAVPKPSNDVAKEAPQPKEYEVVNEPPSQKKKGWWNKLVE